LDDACFGGSVCLCVRNEWLQSVGWFPPWCWGLELLCAKYEVL
jgi:hypothetical protein